MSLEQGKKAPSFTLPHQKGDKVSLEDYIGKHVVLYFYPKDMSPGCTTEACDFRDKHESFGELNAVVVGVSPDPVEDHKTFVDKHDLPFELLADEDHKVCEEYDVWKLKKMFGKEFYGVIRSTFIIDPEGNLQKEFRDVNAEGHVEEALQYIRDNA